MDPAAKNSLVVFVLRAAQPVIASVAAMKTKKNEIDVKFGLPRDDSTDGAGAPGAVVDAIGAAADADGAAVGASLGTGTGGEAVVSLLAAGGEAVGCAAAAAVTGGATGFGAATERGGVG